MKDKIFLFTAGIAICLLFFTLFLLRIEYGKNSESMAESTAKINRIELEQFKTGKKFCDLKDQIVICTYDFYKEFYSTFYFLDREGNVSDAPYELEKFEKVMDMSSNKQGILLLTTNKGGQTFLKALDENGTLLTEVSDEDWGEGNIQSVRSDSEGNLYVLIKRGEESRIYIYNAAGELISTIWEPMVSQGCLRNIKDGLVAYIYIGESVERVGMQLYAQLVSPKQFGEKYALPGSSYDSLEAFTDGAEYDLYYCDMGYTIFGYDLKKEQSTKIVNLSQLGSEALEISKYTVMENSDIVFLTNQLNQEGFLVENKLIHVQPGTLPDDQKTIILAAINADGRLQEAVLRYNSRNMEYCIEIKDYAGKKEPQKQIVLDILSGDMIDIIQVTDENRRMFLEKELLEDLIPYLEQNKLRSRLNQNILTLLMEEDKLYQICSNFMIEGLIGAQGVIQENGMLQITNLEEVLNDKEYYIAGVNKEEMLEKLVACNYNELVNVSEKKCYFEKEGFLKILKIAEDLADKRLEYTKSYEVLQFMEEGIASGSVLGCIYSEASLDVESYQVFRELYQDEVIVTSYPSFRRAGLGFSPGFEYGILSSSECKQAAWEFIEMQFEQEAQMEYLGAGEIPMVDAFLEDYLKEKRKKSDVSEKDIKQHLQTVASIDHRFIYDSYIFAIIEEEAGAYFAGKKTAGEVSGNIQNRVQVYLNEQ